MDKYGLHDVPKSRLGTKCIVHNTDTDTMLHADTKQGPQHFRCNIVLQEPDKGGRWMVADEHVPMPKGWLMAFDARVPHCVEWVEKGQRIVMTYGWTYVPFLPPELKEEAA